jgi:hypothetical protein
MSTFRASARVDGDTLHTERPLTAPPVVGELLDHAILVATQASGEVASVELTVETAGESETPIADGVTGQSSQPLPVPDSESEDVEQPTPPVPGGQV